MKKELYSKDAEQAIIGTILISPNLIDQITLDPEEFYFEEYQRVYNTMRRLGSGGIDIVSLSEALQRKGSGIGVLELTSLINKAPEFHNVETYQRIIRDLSIRRRVLDKASQIAKNAYDTEGNINDAISELITDLVNVSKPEGGAVHISHYLGKLAEEVDKRIDDPKYIYGMETGLEDFDKITRGLQLQEQFILAGQPNTGKSLLAFQLAMGMAEHGYSGVFYQLEMSGVATVRRGISGLSKNPTHNLRSGFDVDYESFLRALAKMESLPMFISDQTDWTTLDLRADLARLKQKEDVQWFVIDYMTLLTDTYGKDDIQRSAFIGQQIHRIAKDLNMAALVIHSLNKSGYGSNPTMASLSGSSNISYDADQIATLVETDDENVVTLIWQKVREAESKRQLDLYKVPNFPVFANYTREQPADAPEERTPYWQGD